MADGALRAPLLGGGADGSEPLPSPGARAGRGLSIAALAPRASSNSSRGSLARSDDRPGPLAAAAAAAPAPHAGFEPPEAPRPGSGRGSGLRFAPAPPSRADSAASSAAASGRPSLSGMRSGGLSSSGALGVGMGKDTAAVLHRSASTKLMQLSAGFHSRAQLEEEEGITLPPSVIHPFDARAHAWWAFIALVVLATMAAEPAFLAFSEYPGLYPLASPDTIVTASLIAAYAADIALNFFVAYHDADGRLVTDPAAIRRHYVRSAGLWFDLATTVPFDWIVLLATGLNRANTVTARYISLLRLLRLGRAYRLQTWVVYLTNNTEVPLFWVTMGRNLLVLFYTTHIGACIFFFLARQTEGAVVAWVPAGGGGGCGGSLLSSIDDASALGKYVYSLYWSAVTFATVGYGDIHANSVAEAAFITAFIYLNVFIGAYIIGTVTLLVTRADEETGRYRRQVAALEQYAGAHSLPQEMRDAITGHLRLHYSAQDAGDKEVLAVLPSALRRRAMAHVYGPVLEGSWLLEGCHPAFLDALLAASKVENVLARIHVVTAGDHVNELMVLVAGACAVEPIADGGGGDDGAGHVALDLNGSAHGGAPSLRPGSGGSGGGGGGVTRVLSPGDPLSAAFFTEGPAPRGVRTVSVVRLLSVGRTEYMALAAAFPRSAERVLANMYDAAAELVADELPLPYAAGALLDDEAAAASLEALALRAASVEGRGGGGAPAPRPPAGGLTSELRAAGGGGGGGSGGTVPAAAAAGEAVLAGFEAAAGRPLSAAQRAALLDMARVRGLLAAQRERLRRERTAELLEAAAAGDGRRLRRLLASTDPNAADYDGRTALMLAAGHGRSEAVALLLAAGADPSAADAFGGCALLEAARGGHDAALDALRFAGARLPASPVATAAHLCTAVFEGDVPLLRRLLRAGMAPDCPDYDGRRPAHIAAAEGSLPALKLLVEEGGADPRVTDRWGLTPLDEARRGGGAAAVAYLEGVLGLAPGGGGG